MNSVNIMGRAGRDAELRYTPTGTAVTELNLAVDDGYGEKKKTAWIGVVCWNKTAEVAANIKKGDRVCITGRLTQDEWADKETGKMQRKTKVTCEQLTFIEGKRDGQEQGQQEPPAFLQRQAAPPVAQPDDDEDSEIPF